MSDALLHWRPEFPILGRTTYLISNSLGAMPKSVGERMKEYVETWGTKGVRAWADEWWEMPVRVGECIAPLIGAGHGQVSMHPNITLMEAIILSCFEEASMRKKKTKIVCEEMNFPSVLYLLGEWTKRRGLELVVIPSDDGISIDPQKMIEAIDEQTLLVPISHVLFKSGFIQETREIVRKAHRVGAFVVLDAYQSVGIIPVDVQALEVDFLVGGVLKWLCGGPGGGFLYVRPDVAKLLKPVLTGWFAHPRPFDFEVGPMEYRDDAFRFLNGTPSIPSLYAATEGPKIIAAIGIDKIREKSVRQTSLLVTMADEMGFRVASPRSSETRGGTVTVDVPHAYEVAQTLINESILVDYRKGAGIRVSPHFYNSDEELVLLMRELREILDQRRYESFRGRKKLVT